MVVVIFIVFVFVVCYSCSQDEMRHSSSLVRNDGLGCSLRHLSKIKHTHKATNEQTAISRYLLASLPPLPPLSLLLLIV